MAVAALAGLLVADELPVHAHRAVHSHLHVAGSSRWLPACPLHASLPACLRHPQVESYQKQLAPQAAAVQAMSTQLQAQDGELLDGMSAVVALRRQVGEKEAAVAALKREVAASRREAGRQQALLEALGAELAQVRAGSLASSASCLCARAVGAGAW